MFAKGGFLAVRCSLAAGLAAAVVAASAPGADGLTVHGPTTLGAGPRLELQSCCVLLIGFSYAPPVGLVAAAEPGGRMLAAWQSGGGVQAAAGSAAGWSQATPVVSWQGPAQGRETTPADAAFGPAGDVLLSWGSYLPFGSLTEIGFAATSSEGAAWALGLALPPAPYHGNAAPVVAFDPRGDAYAVWTEMLVPHSDESEVVKASIAPAGTGVWGPPATLSRPGAYVFPPTIAVDARGDAVVAWGAAPWGAPGKSQTVEAATFTAGAGWQAPVTLGAGGEPVAAVRAADQVLVAWRALEGLVYTATRSLSSGQWTSPLPLAGSRGAVGPPLAGSRGPDGPLGIAIGPGGGDAVWWQEGGPPGASTSRGKTLLRAALEVTHPGARAATIASWPTPQYSEAASLEHPACSGYPTAPALAFDGRGGLTAAWTQGCGAVYVNRRPQDGRWGAPIAVGPLLGEEALPNLAVDGSDDVLAVWDTAAPVPGSRLYATNGIYSAEEQTTSVHAALLSLPAEAPPVKRYMLKHPKHEHCKTHYVRKVKQVKVHGKRVRQIWCVVPQTGSSRR